MTAMLKINELPLDEYGWPLGLYRLKLAGSNEPYFGIRYKDGVSVDPVTGRVLSMQYQAWSSALVIEAWDAETLSMVVNHLERTGHVERAKELAPAARPPSISEEQETEAATPKAKRKRSKSNDE